MITQTEQNKLGKSILSLRKDDVRETFPSSKMALKYRSFTNNTLAVLVQQRWEQLPAFSPIMTLCLPYNEALPS